MKNFNTIIILLVLGISISSCNNNSTNDHGHDHSGGEHDDHGHGAEKEHNENEVILTQQQIETVNITVGEIETQNIGAVIQINGSLEVPPQAKADISPVKGGIVKQINVIEGDAVKKDQVLAVLQHPDLINLQSEYNTNVNELVYIEKEYLRQKDLNNEKVTSDKSFQKTESEYKSLKSKVLAQKTQLQIIGINTTGVEAGKIYSTINVISPFNGVVSAVETNVGTYVEPMSKLFEVVNTQEMHADFVVYEKDVDKIVVGQKIEFSTLNSNQIYEAEIHNISPVFENDPKALHIHADILSEKSHLIPGLYLSGNLNVDDNLLNVVPDDAITEDKGKFYVFVNTQINKGDYVFIKTEIIKGVSANGYTEIKFLEKQKENLKVATSGAFYLLSEMLKEEQEHSH